MSRDVNPNVAPEPTAHEPPHVSATASPATKVQRPGGYLHGSRIIERDHRARAGSARFLERATIVEGLTRPALVCNRTVVLKIPDRIRGVCSPVPRSTSPLRPQRPSMSPFRY